MIKRAIVGFVALVLGAGVASAQGTGATQQLLAEADKAFEADDYDKAAAYYDRAISSEPKGVTPAAYGKRAKIFYFRGLKDPEQLGAGIAWIEGTAEKVYPGDAAILEPKALILAQSGKQAEAVKLAERVVAKAPEYYLLQRIVGDFYYQAGEASADKTTAAYKAYLAKRPSELEAADGVIRLKLGFTLLHVSRFSDAEEQFTAAERKFKGDARIVANARKGLCAAYSGMGNFDRAITMCEQVIREKKALRGDASPYFNIGQAYLAKGQYANALSAANQYLQANAAKCTGYLLRGEVYFKQEKYAEAEREYATAATKQCKGKEATEVVIKQGKTALKQKQPKKAIELLNKGLSQRADDVEILGELSRAYLALGEGGKAATQAEKAVKILANKRELQAEYYALAGQGYYMAGELSNARGSFQKALDVKPTDAISKRDLINTINRQAAARFAKNDLAGAEALLEEALAIDGGSTITNFNLGLVAIEKAQWQDAIKHLSVRLKKQPSDLPTNRLLGRAYLGAKNTEKAAEHYAVAEAEARKLRNLTVLAEVYTEWAPLLLAAGKVEDAVDKLEQAEQYARNQPFYQATQRNYQLALFRRGYERLRARKAADAVADLEGATRMPAVLQGNEEEVFTFALGLAYLDAGQGAKASPIFQSLAKKSGAGWLKPPWDKIGADFFTAYALYREGSSSSRAKAAPVFERLVGKAGGAINAKVKDLLRSTQEYLAYDAYAKGSSKGAEAALKKAEAMGGGNKAAVEHNLAAIRMDRDTGAARAVFERVKDRVPEALVNLGILADRRGDAKEAYDLWVDAQRKGARTPRLDDWISAKKRIFGW
jgi:tetratricopeptide (TPR) repeat protein